MRSARPRARARRRRTRSARHVSWRTAALAAGSVACVGLLLFFNGLLTGVVAASLLEARAEIQDPDLLFMMPPWPLAPQGSDKSTELLAHRAEVPPTAAPPPAVADEPPPRISALPPADPAPELLAAEPAAAEPIAVEPIAVERIMAEQVTIEHPAAVHAPTESPGLPAWARDGLLPRPVVIGAVPLFARLSRPFVRERAELPHAGEAPTALALGLRADGRPQLRFLRSHPRPAVPYGELIYRAARRWSLNPAFVAAVVQVESNFDPRAVSHRGARGLMQLMPATAGRFGVATESLFEPEANLYAGAQYLGWLTDRYGDDLRRVLAAYNAGEGAVDRHGGVPPYPETRHYVRRAYAALGLTAEPQAEEAGQPGNTG